VIDQKPDDAVCHGEAIVGVEDHYDRI
jgi:hypothetical protein